MGWQYRIKDLNRKQEGNLKKIFVIIFVSFLTLTKNVFAGDFSLNKSKIADGIITVQYTGSFNKKIKLTVEKNNERYVYNITNENPINIPLQLGDGTYKITVYKHLDSTNYQPLATESVDANNISSVKLFTYSIPNIYFDKTLLSIKNYDEVLGQEVANDKIKKLYGDVINFYTYDYDKAKKVVSTEYVPFIDDMYSSKKGICYDYSVLMAGVLRSQGIPTKLVMGYAPEIKAYHAWNQIYMNGKWVTVDTTYDASKVQLGKSTSFEKDSKKFKVIKIY